MSARGFFGYSIEEKEFMQDAVEDEYNRTHRMGNVNRPSKRKTPDEIQYHLDHEKLKQKVFEEPKGFLSPLTKLFTQPNVRAYWNMCLTERQQLDSYFALRARLRGFIHGQFPLGPHALQSILTRSRIVHRILQTCRHCDMPWSHERITDDVCNQCQELTN